MSLIWESDPWWGITMQLRGGIGSLRRGCDGNDLRRHNPPHLGPAIVWYLWLMISTNRFVIFLWDEYEWREHGKRLVICLVFILFLVHSRDQFQTETCLPFVSLYRRREGGSSETPSPSLPDWSAAPSPPSVWSQIKVKGRDQFSPTAHGVVWWDSRLSQDSAAPLTEATDTDSSYYSS